MEIAFAGESPDLRNDPRIIDALESDGLLRSGISFTIDQVEVLGRFTDDTVCCTTTEEDFTRLGAKESLTFTLKCRSAHLDLNQPDGRI